MIDFLRNDLFRRVTNGTTSTTTVGPETGKDGAKFTFLKTRERKTIQKKFIGENQTKIRKFKIVVSEEHLFNFI